VPGDSTLTLFIPDLFGFQSILSTLSKDELSQLPETRFPVLEKWLSRGLIKKSSEQNDLVLSEFGVSIEEDNPYAAFTLLAEDIDTFDSDAYWLRADPVYLQADRDTALLVAHEELELSQDEASKLADEINNHFSDEPWQLHALHPHRWYLQLEQAQNLVTHPLANVLGEDINKFNSVGDDAKYWLKINNEIQMLLHGTNVNFERDSRAMLTVNSLWLWGGGTLPKKARCDCLYSRIFTNNIYFKGIANFCDIDIKPLNTALEPQSFVVLDMLSKHVQSRDLYSYIQELNKIESRYLTQCQALLNEGKVKQLKLISSDGFSITITTRLLRRWWKRIKSYSGFKL